MVEASGGPMTGDTGPETFEFDLEDGVLSGELVTGDGRRTMRGLTFRDGTLTWTVPSRLPDAEPMSPRQQALIGPVFYYEATLARIHRGRGTDRREGRRRCDGATSDAT